MMKLLAALITSLCLVACGGGTSTASPEPQSAAKPLAAAPARSAALLDWAEQNYPALFPGPGQAGSFDVYSFRHYPATGNYIGLSGNSVYVLGPFGPQARYMGEISSFRCQYSPSDCANAGELSTQQQRLESLMRGPQAYSAFNVYRGRLDGSDINGQTGFFATLLNLGLEDSPASVAGGVPFTRSDSRLSPNFMDMPDAFSSCPVTPAGADLTVYQLFDVYLDANGALAKYCRRYPSRVEYSGQDVLWHRTDANGAVIRTFKITVSDAVDLAGANIVSDITASSATTSSFSARLAANPATYPWGSQRMTVAGQAQEDYFQVVSFDSQYKEPSALVPVPRSGLFGTVATTIEEALPWHNSNPEGHAYSVSSGTFRVFKGRRIWVATLPTSSASSASHRAFVEIDGKVYCGFFTHAGTPNAYYGIYINPTAKAAVQAANLSF